MKTILIGILFATLVFIGCQMILPFPYGIILGLVFVGIIIWFTRKYVSRDKDSLLNYRRIDPINEDERKQNDEALRILEKEYLEDKISKKEYMKRKKEFEEIEYNSRKCIFCDSEDFEFISEKQMDELDAESDEGSYRCKKCGQHETRY